MMAGAATTKHQSRATKNLLNSLSNLSFAQDAEKAPKNTGELLARSIFGRVTRT